MIKLKLDSIKFSSPKDDYAWAIATNDVLSPSGEVEIHCEFTVKIPKTLNDMAEIRTYVSEIIAGSVYGGHCVI